MSVWRIGKTRISRDLVVAFVATMGLVVLSVAFGGSPDTRQAGDNRLAVRIAYFPNLTHAPALIGIARGEFQKQAIGCFIEPKVVNAGPDAMEALLAGEVDIAYVGPSPAINTYLKSGGNALRILAGACSGGASLIARGDLDIRTIRDLDHRRVAVPQLGGTQDVSIRHFLDLNGLEPQDRGGSVEVLPIKNPDILALFLRKQIDAAWVPEPWASRLKMDAGARTVVDERDLWPGRTFTTTVIVARTAFLTQHPDAVEAVLRANLLSLAWINTNPEQAQSVANSELKRLTGKALSPGVLKEAWGRLKFTDDPNRPNILAFAQAAAKAGYLKGSLDMAGAFDQSRLALARRQSGLGIERW
jgi:NitT/TauT family transport system substrate-binding protein